MRGGEMWGWWCGFDVGWGWRSGRVSGRVLWGEGGRGAGGGRMKSAASVENNKENNRPSKNNMRPHELGKSKHVG